MPSFADIYPLFRRLAFHARLWWCIAKNLAAVSCNEGAQ
jgi:hypothetical protein